MPGLHGLSTLTCGCHFCPLVASAACSTAAASPTLSPSWTAMVVKQKKHHSIQSRTLNVAVVALGVALITLAVDTWFEALRSGGMTDFWGATMDPFVVVFPLLWILLGGWCLVGGIRNLIGRSR